MVSDSVHPPTRAFAIAAIAAAVAGCAANAGRGEESGGGSTASLAADCFNVSLARDFRYLDDSNLIVYAPGRAYHLELSRACLGLNAPTRIALRSRTERMCGFAGDAVVTDGAFAERCPVLSVRRLDDDQLQALIDQFDEEAEGDEGFEVVIPPAED